MLSYTAQRNRDETPALKKKKTHTTGPIIEEVCESGKVINLSEPHFAHLENKMILIVTSGATAVLVSNSIYETQPST